MGRPRFRDGGGRRGARPDLGQREGTARRLSQEKKQSVRRRVKDKPKLKSDEINFFFLQLFVYIAACVVVIETITGMERIDMTPPSVICGLPL